MNTAQENIKLLPARCFGKLLMDNSIIIIAAGENGYHQVSEPPPINSDQSIDDFINEINAEDGITINQRKAMEWGSQFGWGHGLANPDRWDENGKPIKGLFN
jgi:hypothetical protein